MNKEHRLLFIQVDVEKTKGFGRKSNLCAISPSVFGNETNILLHAQQKQSK